MSADSILTNLSLRPRFPDAINEREQARCGKWSLFGPCVCGDWRNHPGGRHPCPHPGCPKSVSNDGVACPDHQEDPS